MDLSRLIRKLDYFKCLKWTGDHYISQISIDSKRKNIKGIYVAITGHNVDGHNFIEEAIKNGSKTIFVEKKVKIKEDVNVIYVYDTKRTLAFMCDLFYNKSSNKLNLCGVTGTNGKTTISFLIHKCLNELNMKNAFIGTNGVISGNKTFTLENTTPGNNYLNQLFKQFVDNKIDNVVMEVSSHSVKQQRIMFLDYDVVIFTNISHDHLDYHKNFEDYYQSKLLLLTRMTNLYQNKCVIVNRDEEKFFDIYSKVQCRVITFGIDHESNVRAKNIEYTLEGSEFDIYINDKKKLRVKSNLIGDFNVYNILAVMSYFYFYKFDLNLICDILKSIKYIDGRMEKINNDEYNIFIDYAHTPIGVKKVLLEIKRIYPNNRIIGILGCGGERDKYKRPLMGKYLSDYCDLAILTTDNPRSEDPLSIINDMEKNINKNNSVVIPDRKQAINIAVKNINKGDVLLVLGKGHEDYQIVSGKKITFNDKIEVQKALSEKRRTNNGT